MTRPSALDIGVVTNAPRSGQPSMLGYGELVTEAARRSGRTTTFAAKSALSTLLPSATLHTRLGKLVKNVDRFGVTPLAMLGRSASIVHVVDPGNLPYLGALRYRAAVATVHDMIPYLALAGRLSGFAPSRTGAWLMARIIARLREVDRIVCISEATRRDVLEITGVRPERIVVIPNAVFQRLAPASPEACAALRREIGVPAHAPLLLHIGRNFYKNRPTVLRVFARVLRRSPAAHLVMVGHPAPDLTTIAAAEGIRDRVRFLDGIAAEKLAALYSTARVLLFPSLYEGFGYPVLEAQLCGTPVICADTGALPEVAGNGALILPPDAVEAMAEAALDLLEDPAASAALVARGHINAQRFSRKAWFAAHDTLYAELGAELHAPTPAGACASC